MAQNMSGGSINLGISPAALLVMEPTGVSDACQHQPVLNTGSGFMVCCEPCDGADRAGNKQEAIGIMEIPSGQKLGQKGGNAQAGKVVIRQ